jgi:hypothetical protein
MDLFRVVSFVEDIGIRFSGSVTLNEKFFCMRDVVYRLLRDLEPRDDLAYSIDGD